MATLSASNSPAVCRKRRRVARTTRVRVVDRQSAVTAGVSAGSEFFWGVRLLGRGFATFARSPRLLLLGAIPAVIAFLAVTAALIALWVFAADIASWITPFADHWSSGWRSTLRDLVVVALVVGSLAVAVLTYTAVTLLIGDPFYEVLSERVEQRLGGTPGGLELPWYRTIRRNLVDSIRLITLGIAINIPLFFLGFIPVAGQIVVPILNAIISGWLVTVELTGIPFNRRGMYLSERRRLLRARRSMALGFGIPVFLLLLIPLAALVVVPAAVAGGTLMTRRILGQPIDVAPAGAPALADP
jgi:CysZ protein